MPRALWGSVTLRQELWEFPLLPYYFKQCSTPWEEIQGGKQKETENGPWEKKSLRKKQKRLFIKFLHLSMEGLIASKGTSKKKKVQSQKLTLKKKKHKTKLSTTTCNLKWKWLWRNKEKIKNKDLRKHQPQNSLSTNTMGTGRVWTTKKAKKPDGRSLCPATTWRPTGALTLPKSSSELRKKHSSKTKLKWRGLD